MNMDLELAAWREEWQRETAPPPDLRRRVERQSRWMRFMRGTEILVTVVFGGGTAFWAMRTGRADEFVFAALTWLSILMAWAISLTSTRGLWSAVAESHAHFLDLSIRRCRAQIRSALFAALLYCFNLTFTLSWVYREQPIRPLSAFLISWRVCVVYGVTLIFFAWLVWHRRRKQAELIRLEELREELEHSMLH